MKRCLLALLLLTGAAQAETLRVPQDFATIQAAVDASSLGDVVLVSAGSYEETVSIVGKAQLTLRGQGQVFLRGGDGDTAVVTVTGGNRVAVERLRFVEPEFLAVHVTDCSDARLSRCRVEDSAGDGLRVDESPTALIERCTVLGGFNALTVTGSEGAQVYRCRVEDAGGTGIIVSGCDGGRIERCILRRTNFFAMVVGFPGGATANSVLRNVVVDAGFGGVDLNTGNSSVRDNRFIRPGITGIQVEGVASGSVLADNLVVQSEGDGIDLKVSGVTARRNRIVKPGGDGIQVGADGPRLLDNVVLHAQGRGVLLGDAVTAGDILGNDALHAVGHGLQVDGSGLHLQDNRALGSGVDGFLLNNGPNQVAHNLAQGSAGFDLNDASTFANFFLGNSFGTIAP